VVTAPNPLAWLLDRRAARRLRARFAWITPQLIQGPCFSTRQARLIAAMGIESVLDLRAEGQHDQTQLDAARLHYHRLSMEEFAPPTLGQITDGTAWALGEMAAGRAVLVHCRLGMSRSVCMACAILIAEGHSFESALRTVRAVRPSARLTESQLVCLAEFAKRGNGAPPR
jgi:protein-tyrosine phosphatase